MRREPIIETASDVGGMASANCSMNTVRESRMVTPGGKMNHIVTKFLVRRSINCCIVLNPDWRCYLAFSKLLETMRQTLLKHEHNGVWLEELRFELIKAHNS
ncbi:hypothetical protein CDAR_406601 [Caerostris darwini]|uniref:Uncharacterized protein n=1 Tax=Caerostris darwini TaxID=1538125 RepID=A0AAV4PS90_9ARAC|nr:hypothetical protein CDAR_406601 [Caerostris darwini]